MYYIFYIIYHILFIKYYLLYIIYFFISYMIYYILYICLCIHIWNEKVQIHEFEPRFKQKLIGTNRHVSFLAVR